MQQSPPTEAHLVRIASDVIRSRLPEGWSLDELGADGARNREADIEFEVAAPDGRTARISGEVKLGTPTGRQVSSAAQSVRDKAGADRSIPLIVARYLSPQARGRLQELGVSYLDATGNVMLSAIDPGIYLADRGADADPWRPRGRPRGTLKGEPAARVVRMLLDHSRAWRVRDLIRAAGASTGATYRVLEYLDTQGLVERMADGTWIASDWSRLLQSWAHDWNFLEENAVGRYIDPRGVPHFVATVTRSRSKYALTGAIAAGDWSSVAPTRSAFVYVEEAERVAAEWGLRPVDTGANVILLEPRKSASVAFENSGRLNIGACRVAAAQVAADLMNGPGRDPAEAEELLRWMRENEEGWRVP